MEFYRNLRSLNRFRECINPDNFRPLPDDWIVGVSDVQNSTEAVAAGNYKSVNMAGASLIAAVQNVLQGDQFPFVFGGDGANFAVPAEHREVIEAVQAACQTWAHEQLGLVLRAAIVPVTDIRAAGYDVRIAKYTPTPHVAYAMFSGNGVHWAEEQMKAGRFGVTPAPAGTYPDLTGLSCRWAPLPSLLGHIMSVIALPVAGKEKEFAQLCEDIIQEIYPIDYQGRPGGERGPDFTVSARAMDLEVKSIARKGAEFKTRAKVIAFTIFAWLLFKTGRTFKGFDPAHYQAQTKRNTDFRKFDDGLKLTIDCTSEKSREIEERLQNAHANGLCNYGIHRQRDALMTCIVPSPFTDDHVHFVDGAAGGYTQAAVQLKQQLKSGMS